MRWLALAGLLLALASCTSTGAWAPREEIRADFADLKAHLAAEREERQARHAALKARAKQGVADLQAFTAADARVTGALACQQNNLAACTCLPLVAERIEARQRQVHETCTVSVDGKAIAGAFCLTQTVHNALHPEGAADDRLRVGCAAYAIQVAADIGRAIATGVKAVESSGGSLVGEIPNLLKVLRALRGLGVGDEAPLVEVPP